MWGVLVAASAYFVAGGAYGLISYGAFDKVIGGTLSGSACDFLGCLRRSGVGWASVAVLFLAC